MLPELLAVSGRTEEAIQIVEENMRLVPGHVSIPPYWLTTVARAHFAAERYEEAVQFAEKSIGYNYDDRWDTRAQTHEVRAASYSRLGRLEKARAALAETSKLGPRKSSEWVSLLYGVAEPEHRQRYLDGLRMAGLEE